MKSEYSVHHFTNRRTCSSVHVLVVVLEALHNNSFMYRILDISSLFQYSPGRLQYYLALKYSKGGRSMQESRA